MGKRHLTPKEIMAQCKAVARERRMCERSPWTAMGIITGYALMTSEGFKGQRLKRIADYVENREKEYQSGKVTIEEMTKRLMDKAGWSITYEPYTEADIKSKKGSYQYWLDKRQIDPQNAINRSATRYLLFMYAALMDEYGYSKERLTRVQKEIDKHLLDYQQDKVSVNQWKKALLEDAGIYYEAPIDPLTQTNGSMMAGG